MGKGGGEKGRRGEWESRGVGRVGEGGARVVGQV